MAINQPNNQETDNNKEVVSDISKTLYDLEWEIGYRNEYINKRDRYIYGDALLQEGVKIPDGHDKTLFNLLKRVVDIHTAQIMGRDFQVTSNYDKEDLSAYENQPEEKDLAEMRNKKRKADADARKKVVDGIIRDNGGYAPFKLGARIGSFGGTTVIKMWADKEAKKIRYTMIESVQNFRAVWSDNNFRERDADAYIYQISEMQAYKQYGNKLKPGENFALSKLGDIFSLASATSGKHAPDTVITSDPLEQNQRTMVTVIDYTGLLPGWGSTNGSIHKVDKGKENEINVLIVGGNVVQTIDDTTELPHYYIVRNREHPRHAWGESDVSESLLQINATLLQVMSDAITLGNKTLFPKWLAKGWDVGATPKPKQRQAAYIPASQEQSLELVQNPVSALGEYENLVHQIMDFFVREAGVGRVLFDDPEINTNSNQALITTLKSVIDIVEDKQSRWTPVLIEMFTDALELSASFVPELRDAVSTDEEWHMEIEWPSVLRREDATYQQMLLNWFNAGTLSYDTVMEKLGYDASEERDRLIDNMSDPVLAAVLGHQLPLLAQQEIAPPQPVQPQTKYNVNVKADATLNPVENEAVISEVMGATQFPATGTPPTSSPNPTQANPTLTSDQNVDQTASQPGSGATAVSPQGAINQLNQQQGK